VNELFNLNREFIELSILFPEAFRHCLDTCCVVKREKTIIIFLTDTKLRWVNKQEFVLASALNGYGTIKCVSQI